MEVEQRSFVTHLIITVQLLSSDQVDFGTHLLSPC